MLPAFLSISLFDVGFKIGEGLCLMMVVWLGKYRGGHFVLLSQLGSKPLLSLYETLSSDICLPVFAFCSCPDQMGVNCYWYLDSSYLHDLKSNANAASGNFFS